MSLSIAGGSLTGKTYTHNSRFQNAEILHGIDVSQHQGTIDWDAVKNSGIDFVIIRAGYRGYGSSGSYNEDTKFHENIKAAKENGIDVGAYFFSQAISNEEAVAEAKYFLSLVEGYEFELPLVMDFEYASDSTGNIGRLYNANLTIDESTAVVSTFCDTIEAHGYTAMIYANRSMLEDDLYANQLQGKYPIWLANYVTKTGYEGEYSYWQYADTGSIAGITGNVDSNFRYLEAPGTVSKPQANLKNNSTAELGWGKVKGAYGYEIYRKAPGEDKYSKIGATVGAASTSYKDGNLTLGGNYSYKIRAYYKLSSGNVKGSYSDVVTVTLKGKPQKITGFKADKSTTSALSFSWDKIANVDGYRIYRYDSSSESYVRLTTIEDSSIGSYTDSGLTDGQAYKYRMRAYNIIDGKKVFGDYSEVLTMATRPKQSTGLTYNTVTKTSIKLTWKKQPGVTGYRVYRYDEETGKYQVLTTITGASKNSYTDSGLEAGTNYKYKVRAYKKGGSTYYGELSEAFSIYTLTSNGIVSGSSVNIRKGAGTSYSKVTTASKYQVASVSSLVKNGDGEAWYKIKFTKGSTSYTGYIMKSYFKLRADKVQDFSSPDSTTSSISLSWKAAEGTTSYALYRHNPSKDKYERIADIKGRSNTTYTDKGLNSRTVYKYKIRAYRTVDGKNFYGSYSDIISIATEPNKVQGLTVKSTTSSSVKLSWNKISSVTGYRIYRYNESEGKYKEIATFSGASNNYYTDKGLEPGKTYKYKVRAYKSGDKRAYGEISSDVSATTKSKEGTVTGSSINVRSGAGTSYSIITQVDKGQAVEIVGTEINSAGETWYKVKFTKSGKSYTGYIIKAYIKVSN